MTVYHFTTLYAIECVEKKRIVGRMEMLACLRHLRDLSRSGQLPKAIATRIQKAGYTVPHKEAGFAWQFDEVQADFVAVDWFASLKHVEGRPSVVGKPIKLVDSHRWELSMIFGWTSKTEKIRRTNGRLVGARRFKKAFVTEARKNSKTTRGSGIGLYGMVGDMEMSPEVYCTALDTKQARKLYNAAHDMGKASHDVSTRLKIGKYEINHRTRGGIMCAFSGEIKNKDSFNPSIAFIDEYHVHPTSEMYNVMESAQGQRSQPLIYIITTAGKDTESPCYKEYEYCKMILEGQSRNDRYFVMIRELDEKDDEHDQKNWVKSNPLIMSDPITAEEFKQAHDAAFDSLDPAKIREFRVKKLNKWVEGNEHSYMGDYLVPLPGEILSRWDQCAVPSEEFIELTRNRLCLHGLDLSKKIDLTACGSVFDLGDGRIAVKAMGFIPDSAVKSHEQSDKIPYRDWIRMGWVTRTDGDVTDYRAILDYIVGCRTKHGWRVHEIPFDPYNATHFSNELGELGYICVEVAQWMKILSEPTKMFRELVVSRKLVHDGSPLLRWAVANAREIVDTKENIMISKKNASSTKRVDPLTSILTAMTRLQSLKEGSVNLDDILSDDWGM
jgi:phage terminase large subunit-like protein